MIKSISFSDRKFYSLLAAATLEVAVDYLQRLSDNIIAGNMLGEDALAAIGLVSPVMSVLSFLAVMASVGTSLCYVRAVGSFERKRAHGFFSQGILLAFLFGALLCVVSFPAKNVLFGSLGSQAENIAVFARDYYSFYRLSMFVFPLSYVLSVFVFSDGDETLGMVANIAPICVNIVCSIVLCHFMGIAGIALASGIGSLSSVAVLSLHFFKKSNSLRFVWHFSFRECLLCLSYSLVDSALQLFWAVLIFALNAFIVKFFDAQTLVVMALVVNLLELGSLFDGIGSAMQPLVGTFFGERNWRGVKSLMHTAEKTALAEGVALSVFVFIFAPILVRAFGITDADIAVRGVHAFRIMSVSMTCTALTFLFSSYYLLTDRVPLALGIVGVKECACPIVFAIGCALCVRTEIGLWTGLVLAPVAGIVLPALFVRIRYGRSQFPLLLDESASEIFCYDFELTPENAVATAKTAGQAVSAAVDGKTNMQIQILIEELGLLILEKNGGLDKTKHGKKIHAECTLMIEPNTVRIILRDSGIIFDITDADARVSSFRQFFVASVMERHRSKAYLTTTGYNRNEFAFPREER